METNKKVVQINTVCNGSTGQIMHDIQQAAEQEGYDTISFVGRRKVYTDLKCEKFGNAVSFWMHVIVNTLLDAQGSASYVTTRRLIKRLHEENPDIIHLHNLHGYYLNLSLLFRYLQEEYKGKIYWTFHDCWPFTGHCPYFVMAQCDRWKSGCHDCPQKKQYPVSLGLDASARNYRRKSKLFTSPEKLVIITPSQWMKGLIEESFFEGKRVEVVPNGIDHVVFYPRKDKAQIRRVLQKYRIGEQKKILLGVASIWEKRKGLELFVALAGKLSQDYVIVLAGLTKKQIRKMPENVIGIERTENREELAVLYSAAHIFLNPSIEESFSMVTVEAMACGAPVIALDTSAVKELVDEECGIVIDDNRPEAYLEAIALIEKRNLSKERIARKAERYSKERMVESVLRLYAE